MEELGKNGDDRVDQNDLDYLKKMLLLASLEISKKNKILAEINVLIKKGRKEKDATKVSAIIQAELGNQDNITSIELMRSNNDFFEKLSKKFPLLSELDRQLCAYCFANLSSKDISIIRGVEIKTIEMARYRLRRKLDIPKDMTIHEFLQRIG
jgi:hypothetical protein